MAFAIFSASSLFAQRGKPSGGNDHRDVHIAIKEIETQIQGLLNEAQKVVDQNAARNVTLRKTHMDHNRAKGADRDKLARDIDVMNHEGRMAAVELQRCNLELQRLQISLEQLTRYDGHLIEREGDHGGHKPKAGKVSRVDIVKTYREGPVRIPGRGVGWNNVIEYKVSFEDGTRQLVETKSLSQ